ncbi:hypothetical protein CBS63078_8384 [Aspergillus niger]|uniref:Hydrophobin n=1 Tax=Aspergillus niger TaxID=5061 RepID=A0A505I8C6_ASPNG|nr:hypothetical protein CBS133816_6687 [Aspergillus niger]KAI2847352.1 hypothetical protein CBS12448_9342 [Aspergillus niger]KAI2874712.1 hypothetical protein CBS13152_9755 [Aspergillus niger]KAI2883640.1 hypothetical protein CBS11852_9050 [Aspergillus niger]KAI2895963.1 hypothetical protein CBS63078_8384 [Aspergillus niger]
MKSFSVATLLAATAVAGVVPQNYQWISHNDRSESGLTRSHAQNACGTNNVRCCQGFSPEHGLSRQDESRFRAGLGEGVPGELQGGNNCGPCGNDQGSRSVACCSEGSYNLISLPCIAIGRLV